MASIDTIDAEKLTYFNKQAVLLMDVLHDMKHIDFETALKKMYEYFPHWRCVEFYSPNEGFTAVEYLFNEVLLLE